MRLLVLTTSYPTPANPGSGIFISRMLKRLPDDIAITVLAPEGDQPVESSPGGRRIRLKTFRYARQHQQVLAHQPGGIPAVIRSKAAGVWRLPFFCAAMLAATLVQAARSDLIHAHWSASGLIAGLAGLLTHTPVIVTLHGTDVRWAQTSVLFRWILAICLRTSARVITVGHTMARHIQSRWPGYAGKVAAICNGVGREFWDLATAPYPESGQWFTFGIIGNLIPGKRVETAIRALGLAAGANPRLRLRIVGDGPQKAHLHRLVSQLGLDRRVEFVGPVDPVCLARQLSRCHALVLASEGEGRPSIVMEAMAAGVPVIAGRLDGVQEMIQHGQRGLLFRVGDADQLAGHMIALSATPALGLRLADNARRWLRSQGSTWRHTALQYARVYREVLAAHRRGN
jgi:glycosyltransferase involved in cell wall biosynthesis